MAPTSPVTVVMPAYKGARHIAAAIESVRRQTLPVAEIIVVDDGSPDEKGEIARALGARVIRQENSGAAAARNRALRAATQEWVAFLDHDDVWEPEKIEWQWRAHLLRPDAGVISCDFREFDDADGRLVGPSVYRLPETGMAQLHRERVAEGISHLPKAEPEFFQIVRKNVFLPSALMVRRELAFSVGLFQEDLMPDEDIDFFLRLLARSPLLLVERPLMRYRRHEHNISRDELRNLSTFFRFIRRMHQHPHLYPGGGDPRAQGPSTREIRRGGPVVDRRRAVRRGAEPPRTELASAPFAARGGALTSDAGRAFGLRPPAQSQAEVEGRGRAETTVLEGSEMRGQVLRIANARPVSAMLSETAGPCRGEELRCGAVPDAPEEDRR